MNIFKLDENPFVCAKYHCDKHVPKMGLETTQMMNTAIHYYRDRFSATFVKFKKDIDQAELKELSPRGMIDYYITDAIETEGLKLYKPTHISHPCSRWLLAKDENFVWLYFFDLQAALSRLNPKKHSIFHFGFLAVFADNPTGNLPR